MISLFGTTKPYALHYTTQRSVYTSAIGYLLQLTITHQAERTHTYLGNMCGTEGV